jgi:acetyltransferase-like isoleucine patch superfamily enzyme
MRIFEWFKGNRIHWSVKIGPGTKIGRYCIIEEDVEIGADCWIGNYVHIRPKVHIGDHSEIRDHVFLAGEIQIGRDVKIFQFANIGKGSIIHNKVYIGVGSILTNTMRISHGRKFEPEIKAPVIEYGARLAVGVRILPGVNIGEQSLIGAGAVVTKDTEPFGIYLGVPAHRVSTVPPEELL